MRRLLVLLLAVLLAATACGNDDSDQAIVVDDDAPTELAGVLAAAGTETLDAGSSKVYFEASMPGMGVMVGTGEFDFVEERGRLSFDFSALGATMGAPPGTELTAEMISTGTVLYMRMPFLNQFLGGDDQWIRIDLTEAAAQTGVDISQFSQLGSSGDPTQALSFLFGVSDSVTELGLEEITLANGDGPTVDATRYHAVVDLREAYEGAGAVVDEAQLRAFIDQIGTEQLEVDVWVDDDGRMVRMAYAMPLPDPTGAAQQMDIVMDMYDFGASVEISEPDPSQVIELSELIGAGAGAGTAP